MLYDYTSEFICCTYIDTPPILFLDMAFQSGDCLNKIMSIENAAEMNLAMMQYYYFTCNHEKAVEKAKECLKSENPKFRMEALLIFTFANMAMDHVKETHIGLRKLKKIIAKQSDFSRESGIPLMLSAMKTVLHIPITDIERKEIAVQSHDCTEGGRLLCCYLLEQEAWNNKEWERVIGSVETALHMTRKPYPLITVYFYLSASEAALHLKDIERAEIYFQRAWKLVEADGFWAPVSEMRGHLQLFLEIKVKRQNPEAYKQIMQATHQYRSRWKKLICEEIYSKEQWKRKNMQENLSGMEYAVAFLASIGWSNQEISDCFGLSIRTVKYYMTNVFCKLNIKSRQQISGLLIE